jgi:polyisoprenoid-binding protein YceI
MKASPTCSLIGLSFLLSVPLLAQHRTFVVDPNASAVKMTLKTNHEIVNGSFHVESGSIEYDASTASIGGNVTVAAGSGQTGNDSRDKKMKKDILKVPQYASVSFAPKSYRGKLGASGDSTIEVTGVFTLLGTPHDLTIPMQVHIDGSHAEAKATFIVPYVQWGLKNPSFLVWKADNDVSLDLDLVGQVGNQ